MNKVIYASDMKLNVKASRAKLAVQQKK